MKKFYAILAAALMSVSVFAAKDVVPSDAVLADYYEQGNVCVCFYVPAEMNCNDIVLTGSFNGWSTKIEDCVKVEAVEGYDGWYVASFEPEAEPDVEKGVQAKPIMTDIDGNFNWDYQVGTATKIRGGVEVVKGSFEGQIDLINYGIDAPNVFTVDSWLQNPCTAIYHNYTITVVSAGCDGYVVPFLVGSMNNWTFQKMTLDVAKTQEYQIPTYYISFKAAEGTPYQIVSGKMDGEGVVPTEGEDAPAWNDNAYLQKYIDSLSMWVRYPGEEGDNTLTHEEANIVYDLRAEDLRWARCDDSPVEYVVITVNLPAENCPEAVEIIGGFDGWAGTAMEKLDTGWWFAELEAKAAQFFKFRGAGSWDQELELYNAENDEWAKIGDNQLVFGQLWEDSSWEGTACKWIELDLGNPEKARWTTAEGIENVVLTEKAQKVVVDGVLYIVRDNKMFNVQGTQVR